MVFKRCCKYWFFILSLLLDGCSLLGTTYEKPKVDMPTQWINHQENFKVNDSVNLPELAWWQQFNDPELNELIKQGLQYNNNVNIAIANVEYAQGQLKQVQLSWLPGASLWGGYSQMPDLGNPGYFYGLIPSYTLNILQQIKQQKSAEYQLEASNYAKDSMRLTVIGQITASYFTVLAQNQALILYKQLLENKQKLLKLYKSQYHFGLISQDEISALNSDIQQTQAQLNLVEQNIVVSKNALHFLLNQNPGNMILKTPFSSIDSNKMIPGNLPATVLNNRPDVRQAEALLKAANTNIAVASSNLLPSIQLDSFLGKSFTGNSAIDLNEAYINIPVLNPPVFGQIQASQAQYKAMYIYYVNTIRAALRDVENDLSAYSLYSKQLKNNIQAFDDEQQRCHLADSRYRHGIDSQTEVTQCQITLDNFALMLNQNQLEKMMIIVALYQDLAGGYQNKNRGV